MTQNQIIRIGLKISVSLLIIGILFIMMRWPGSILVFSVGAISTMILYWIRFLRKKPKIFLDHVKLSLVTALIFHYMFGVFHWPLRFIWSTASLISFILCVGFYIKEGVLGSQKSIKNIVSFSSFVLLIIIMIIGVLFKIMHWPYGNELIIVSMLLLVGIVLMDTNLFL